MPAGAAQRPLADLVAAGCHLQAAVLHRGVVEEDHRGRHPGGDRRDRLPVGEVLVQDDRATVLGALDVQLFGEERDVVLADDRLAGIDQPRIQAPVLQRLGEVGERLTPCTTSGANGSHFTTVAASRWISNM